MTTKTKEVIKAVDKVTKILASLSPDELVTLENEIDRELNEREAQGLGFEKIFRLSEKAVYPCTYKQQLFAERLAQDTGSVIEPEIPAISTRFECKDMIEAISLMIEGKRIKIAF